MEHGLSLAAAGRPRRAPGNVAAMYSEGAYGSRNFRSRSSGKAEKLRLQFQRRIVLYIGRARTVGSSAVSTTRGAFDAHGRCAVESPSGTRSRRAYRRVLSSRCPFAECCVLAARAGIRTSAIPGRRNRTLGAACGSINGSILNYASLCTFCVPRNVHADRSAPICTPESKPFS